MQIFWALPQSGKMKTLRQGQAVCLHFQQAPWLIKKSSINISYIFIWYLYNFRMGRHYSKTKIIKENISR